MFLRVGIFTYVFSRMHTALLSSSKLVTTSRCAPKLRSLPTDSRVFSYIPQLTPSCEDIYTVTPFSHKCCISTNIKKVFTFTHLHTKMNPFLHKNSPQCHYFYWWLQTIYCAIIKHCFFLRDCEFEHSLPINSLFYHTPLEITKKNNIRSEAHIYTHSCQGAIL